jgi:hypothetical protein
LPIAGEDENLGEGKKPQDVTLGRLGTQKCSKFRA